MKIKKITLLLLFLLTAIIGKAQEIETILLAKEDAVKLTNGYLKPAFKGLIYSMSNGWYHTAKVHKKFGFDITIGANGSFIPTKDELFDVAQLNLSDKTTILSSNTNSPTVAGSENKIPARLRYTRTIDGTEVSADFDLPKGIKEDLPLSIIPAPAVQIGVGLPFKLDAIIRYAPKVGTDDVKGGLFGIGFKKEITDWFGPLDKTPLNIALLAAYSNMEVIYTIDDTSTGAVLTDNATTEFNLNTYTFKAIASLNFPIVNVFGGVGYVGGNSRLEMLGKYTLIYDTEATGTLVEETVIDPLALKQNVGGINATLGLRFNIGFFKIFGRCSFQEYTTINGGIAFSFR